MRCGPRRSTSTARGWAGPRADPAGAPDPRPRRRARAARPAPRRAARGRAGARSSPSRSCVPTGSSGPSSCGASRPGSFSDETCELLAAFASQSAVALTNARLYQQLEQQSVDARRGQPAQVGVPREHVARAAHPAQRRHRLLRGAPRADVRRPQRAAGGLPQGHPLGRPPPARAARRHPRPVEDRGRTDGARPHDLPDRRRPRPGALARARAGGTARHTADARGAERASASSRPTSCASSRCCSTC